jgi:MoaA/NifB/PqqE/SkfB family radical SAM enzyme
MCNVWHNPTIPGNEIRPEDIEKLPSGLRFVNITGGEPFVRRDISEVIEVVRKKTKRIVISTNGFFTDRIVELCKKYKDLGIRISIEGLPKTNDAIRGISDGFDRGLRTLLTLRKMGIKDIGFAITVQDMNYKDLLPLYELSDALDYEFATATVHNSHYFHKSDNVITRKNEVCWELSRLIVEMLKSRSVKKWFRAYFNYGIMNYICGGERLLPCEMGEELCFIDPNGDVLACNGMDKKLSMGNIKEKTFDEIWNSDQADKVRTMVSACDRQCWMVGSAVLAIRKHLNQPAIWVIKNKLRIMFKKEPLLHHPENI